jgi:hypothetical protein
LGGGVGDGYPDGHLVLVGPVEDLDVQGGVEGFADLGRGGGELAGGAGDGGQERGVVGGDGLGVQLGELLLGGCAFGGAFAVAVADPLPVAGGCGVGAGFFQFRHERGLAGLDLLELPAEGGGPPVAIGALLSGGGGQLGRQHRGAVTAEHALVQHAGDDLGEQLVGQAGVDVAGVPGRDAGVGHVG